MAREWCKVQELGIGLSAQLKAGFSGEHQVNLISLLYLEAYNAYGSLFYQEKFGQWDTDPPWTCLPDIVPGNLQRMQPISA